MDNIRGDNIRLAPAATASLLSPFLSCCIASWTATRDELQAVSTVICIKSERVGKTIIRLCNKGVRLTLGPCQSKKYDIRFDVMLIAEPVAK